MNLASREDLSFSLTWSTSCVCVCVWMGQGCLLCVRKEKADVSGPIFEEGGPKEAHIRSPFGFEQLSLFLRNHLLSSLPFFPVHPGAASQKVARGRKDFSEPLKVFVALYFNTFTSTRLLLLTGIMTHTEGRIPFIKVSEIMQNPSTLSTLC